MWVEGENLTLVSLPATSLIIMCWTLSPRYSVDVVGDARFMPFSDASMDVVLITQVLEHIPDPIAVIGEIRRVLKPGGTLLLSVPSIFPQHGSPGDYWRYMPQGLEWILRDFQSVTVKGEAGTVPSIFLVVNVYLQLLTSPWPWLEELIRWTICPREQSGWAAGGKDLSRKSVRQQLLRRGCALESIFGWNVENEPAACDSYGNHRPLPHPGFQCPGAPGGSGSARNIPGGDGCGDSPVACL